MGRFTMGNLIKFPNSQKPTISAEEYSNLMFYNVTAEDGSEGVYIDGFACKADVDEFIKILDHRFLKPIA